jgi:2-succinyl-5-enolpyruvyl-6-hydroxy-3-cyclohexene-1-carboxylate synthase
MAFPNGLVDLVELLALQGVEDAVICPGSRNAPIMLALVRNTKIKCYSISDERSAGFFALGLSLKSKKPSIICCTSGSAALNFAPAVVEAFFQEVPMIVISADRPKEWIGQWDGQTIYQNELFGKHVKGFWSFETQLPQAPEEITHNFASCFQTASSEPKGPVHINVPISEPFYPEIEEQLPEIQLQKFHQEGQKIYPLNNVEKELIHQYVSNSSSILVTVGQMEKNLEFDRMIKSLVAKGIPVIGDSTSNLPAECLFYHDLILINEEIWPDLKPDLHIHFGKSFVSKRIKQFLRSNQPNESWLIHPKPIEKPDPFQCLTRIFATSATEFLQEILSIPFHQLNEQIRFWTTEKLKVAQKQVEFFSIKRWNELAIYNYLFRILNQTQSDIHVANSLAVRYLNWTNDQITNNEVFSNRGTSGIDGCLSTALGASQRQIKLTISIIGDVAFQYDKNALWNNYLPNQLRIIVFNNQGGGIFRNLAGAKELPELEEFMETKQGFTAENCAKDAQINYRTAKNWLELENILPNFLDKNENASILEIFTDSVVNAEELKKYMQLFRS